MLQLDITDPASVSNAISTILKEQGSIDVLVNNAGMGISGAIELTTEEEIQRQMNTNFTGAIRMCSSSAFHARSRTRTNHKYQFHRRSSCRTLSGFLQCIKVCD